jgi:hypothetical protein
MPEGGLRDGSAPDGSAPDGGAPDGSAPDGSAPDGSAPDSSAPDGGPGQPVPTTFTLENNGSAPLVIGNQCGGSFLSLQHEGEPVFYDRSCSCACDEPDACGCLTICLYTQELVMPGKGASIEWDGLHASYEEGAGCYELASFPRGEALSAQGCWDESPDGEVFACESVDFAYGLDREVVIPAEHHSAARLPVRIVLENQTGAPIQIMAEQCGVQGWFELDLPVDEGESAAFDSFCPCPCDAAFQPSGCPSCGGCTEPVVMTLQPGGTHAIDWDGMFWYGYASGCSQLYPMPAGYLMNAQACFTREGATERTCQPVTIVMGETDEVVVAAQ